MNVVTLDTLACSKWIQQLGLTCEQAEGLAELAKERETALLAKLGMRSEASRRTSLSSRNFTPSEMDSRRNSRTRSMRFSSG